MVRDATRDVLTERLNNSEGIPAAREGPPYATTLRCAAAQKRQHRGPLGRVRRDVQEGLDRQHPARAAGRRSLERCIHEGASRCVTTGERLAHRFHGRGLDAGALGAEVLETRGQRGGPLPASASA